MGTNINVTVEEIRSKPVGTWNKHGADPVPGGSGQGGRRMGNKCAGLIECIETHGGDNLGPPI